MTDTTIETETEAAALLGKANSFADALTQIVAEHSPEAWETALAVARVQGASTTLAGIFAVGIGIALLAGARWAYINKIKGQDVGDDLATLFWLLGALISGFIGIAVGLIEGGSRLASLWPWVAIFNPELYIAHRVLEGVL